MFTQKLQGSQIVQVKLLTVQEVAEWAKVSTKTIYRWISDNKIPAIRLGKGYTQTNCLPYLYYQGL
jgi:excisionase family DNA binding protein